MTEGRQHRRKRRFSHELDQVLMAGLPHAQYVEFEEILPVRPYEDFREDVKRRCKWALQVSLKFERRAQIRLLGEHLDVQQIECRGELTSPLLPFAVLEEYRRDGLLNYRNRHRRHTHQRHPHAETHSQHSGV